MWLLELVVRVWVLWVVFGAAGLIITWVSDLVGPIHLDRFVTRD